MPIQNIAAADKLIIRITGFGCTPCLEHLKNNMPELRRLIDSVGWDNTVVILTSNNPRDILSFRQTYAFPATVLISKPGTAISPIETTDQIPPYYFMILYPGLQISNCYFPIAGTDTINKAYFQSIVRYFKNRGVAAG